MNLLTIAEDESLKERFEPHFEEVHLHSIEDVKIDVDEETFVSYVNGERVEDYDGLFIRPTPKAINFTRIFLETLVDKEIETNMDGTSYYIIAKKPYLFKVLSEKGVNIPKTYVVSTRKSLKNIKKDFQGRVICKQYEGFVRKDIMKTNDLDDIEAFSESLEHGRNYMIVQDFVEGDVYDCLYIDGEIISTKVTGDTWRKSPHRENCSEKYHKLPGEVQELVFETADAIGSRFCSVRVVGTKVVDMKMNPDIEGFKKVSGKDTFGKVVEMLRPEEGGDEE